MWKRFGFLALVLAIAFMCVAPVSAAPIITPVLVESKLDSLQSKKVVIDINNPYSEEQFYLPSLVAIRIREDGSIIFDKDLYSPLLEWVTFSRDYITVEANDIQKFEVRITVPQNTVPGSYNVALLLNESDPEVKNPNTNASALASVAIPILITVPGQADVVAEITEFEPSYALGDLAAQLFAKVENKSSYNIIPRGVINIDQQFGFDTNPPVNFEFNEDNGRVLGDSARVYITDWVNDGNLRFGLYEAELVLAYGDNNNVLTATTQFWVIPWYLIIALLVVAILLVIMVIWYRRSRVKFVKLRNV